MKSTISSKLMFALAVLSFLVGLYVYPALPDVIGSHWAADGNVNGTMSKLWGVFLLPLMMMLMLGLFLVIPRIDPLKENIESFRPVFNRFWVAIQSFLFYVFALTLAWNLGTEFNMTSAILPGLAVILFVAASLLEQSKRSWFVGIRTPWTMSSDVVWEKTNRLAGTLFRWCALIVVLGALVGGDAAFWFIMVSVLGSAVWSVIYSYVVYRKLR